MATHEIIIKRPPVDGNTEGISPTPSKGIATQRGQSVVGNTGSNTGVLQSATAKIATQTLQSVAQVYVAQKTTEVNVLTGSEQYAQRQAVINSVVTTGVNLASGAIQGAGMLSMLGIATGGTGFALGLALTVATTAISGITNYVQTKNTININYQAEEQELNYLRSRAGPHYNGSR